MSMTIEQFKAIANENTERRSGDPQKIDFTDRFPFDKLSPRPDLHAMLLLDAIMARGADYEYTDMVSAAEHDQIWLNVDLECVLASITEDEVRQLDACGVRLDEEFDCFGKFV